MAKVKVEWVKLSPAGEVRSRDILDSIVGAPLLLEDIGTEAVLTSAAPAWPNESRQQVDRGYLRVTVLEDAVLVAWGAEAGLEPENGLLLVLGAPTYLSMRSGWKAAFIASPDIPASPAGGGGGGGEGGGGPLVVTVVDEGSVDVAAGAAADVITASGTPCLRSIRNRGPSDATYRVGATASGAAGERRLLVGEEKTFSYASGLKVSAHSADGTTIEWETAS